MFCVFPFKEICCDFLFILHFFINVITSNRNQLELAHGKINTYWKYMRLSHKTQRRTEPLVRLLERQKTRKLWGP